MTNPADIMPPAKKTMDTHTLEIARLKAALSEAIRLKDEALQSKDSAIQRQGELQSQLEARGPNDQISTNPCYFLEKIPIEIRNHIYSLLLVNPLISKPGSINRNSVHGETIKLDLSPEILRVNSQIYDEASSILYGSNVFRVECLYRQFNPMSAITRKIDDSGHHESYKSMQNSPVVAKVKHWKVIVTAYKACVYEAPCADLVSFCRAICTSKPLSLQVLVIPEGMEKQDPNGFTYEPDTDTYHFLRDAIKCLSLIREVGTFTLLDAQDEDLPSPPSFTATHANPPTWGQRTPMQERRKVLPHIVQPGLKIVIEGNTPIEYAFKMQKNLVAYAQAFERHAPFKKGMDVPYGAAKHSLAEREGWEPGGSCIGASPYRTAPEFHPVEDNLERAAKAADVNNVRIFKKYRSNVLEQLERDYRRIVAASMDMNNFIKYHKTPCGIFDVEPHSPGHCDRLAYEIDDYTQALMLLEKYVESFKRSVTPFVALQIRKFKRTFELYYASLPREQRLSTISLIHEREMYRRPGLDFGTFVNLFRACVDDCDKQYLEIRSARKALFDHDTIQAQANFLPFTQTWRCDEMVNWEVNEPPMDVPVKPVIPSADDDLNAAPPGFGAFLQNVMGGGGPGGGPGMQLLGGGTAPGGFGLTFGVGPVNIPGPFPNIGNPGAAPPNPGINMANQAINALTAMFGPPGQGPPFNGPPPAQAPVANNQGAAPLANPPQAAAQPAPPQGVHWGNAPQAATNATGNSAAMGTGLAAGQWLDDSSNWTSASDDEDEDEEDDEDEDDEEEEDSEDGSSEDEESDEDMPDLVEPQH